MNLFKFARKLAVAKLTNSSIPFQVTINLLDTCNLSCQYCYVAYHSRRLKSIPFDRLMRLIDELAEAGTVKINLAGGEPLLYKQFDEVVSAIVERGMDCYVNTNGYFVEDHIESLKKIACLNVSLDGDKDCNDLVRRAGSFEKAIKALELAQKHNIPRQITCVCGTHNLDQLDFLVQVVNQYDAQIVLINLISPLLRGLDDCQFSLSDEQARNFFQEVLKRKKRGEPFVYSKGSIEWFLNWPLPINKEIVLVNDEFPGKPMKCYAGRFYCVVDTNGDLYPCCPSIGVLKPAANILNRKFKDAFTKLRHHPCLACNITVGVDMNMLFALDPSTILNVLKVYKKNP